MKREPVPIRDGPSFCAQTLEFRPCTKEDGRLPGVPALAARPVPADLSLPRVIPKRGLLAFAVAGFRSSPVLRPENGRVCGQKTPSRETVEKALKMSRKYLAKHAREPPDIMPGQPGVLRGLNPQCRMTGDSAGNRQRPYTAKENDSSRNQRPFCPAKGKRIVVRQPTGQQWPAAPCSKLTGRTGSARRAVSGPLHGKRSAAQQMPCVDNSGGTAACADDQPARQ